MPLIDDPFGALRLEKRLEKLEERLARLEALLAVPDDMQEQLRQALALLDEPSQPPASAAPGKTESVRR